MHTKIIKHQCKLSHACSLVLKSLKNQHIHLGTLLIIVHSFAKEFMHKLRTIISVKPKIMVNSQDVYSDITIRCAEVELKNINIFSKKYLLGSFDRNGKQFI
jgi:hypothetical protein